MYIYIMCIMQSNLYGDINTTNILSQGFIKKVVKNHHLLQ